MPVVFFKNKVLAIILMPILLYFIKKVMSCKKLDCIREPTVIGHEVGKIKIKINFVFPLIWINFSRSRKQINLLSLLLIEILY